MPKNQNYSLEFRAEAVKLVLDQGVVAGSRGEAIGDSERDVGEPGGSGQAWRCWHAVGAFVSGVGAQNARLRKELVEAKMGFDALKLYGLP